MKSLGKILSTSIVAAMLLGIILLMRTPSAAHANTLPQVSPQGTSNWQRIITQANPYVHVVNGSAAIDPQINQSLSQDDVILVKQAVVKFNSLPASIRDHPSMSGVSTANSTNARPSIHTTSFAWSLNWYWWGARLWVNSDLANALGAGSIVPAYLLALLPPVGTLIGLLVAVDSSAILIANYECSSRGVFLDFPYLPIGNFLVTPVC